MKTQASVAKKLTLSIVTAMFIALAIVFISLLYYSNNLYEQYLLKEVKFQENRITDILNSTETKLRTSSIYIENMTRLAYEPTNILKEIKKTFPYIDQISMLDENYTISNLEPFDSNMLGQLFGGANEAAKDNLSFVYKDGRFYVILPSIIEVGAGNIPIGFVVVNYNLNTLFERVDSADLLFGICSGGELIFNGSLGKFVKDACKIKETAFKDGTYFSKHDFLNKNFNAVFVVDKFYATYFKNSHLMMLLFLFTVLVVSSFSIVKVVAWRVTGPISKFASKIGNMEKDLIKTRFSETGDDEVGVLARAVNTMLEKIEVYQKTLEKSAHLAAIGQSTAMVAHDVRRPLTSMRALLSILPSIKDDPAQLEKMSANVDQTITRTNAMLNEIMDFSRDATALELKECAPKVIFASAVSEALRNHPDADVEIAYELDSEHVFYCDVTRVTRVFANLIDNALGAMESKGRGRLRLLTHDEVKEGKRFIVAEVRDSGGGIPEEYLPKIFDPFFTKGKKGGTGLGLAICQKIVSMHGGEIKAWNIPTIGAVFSVRIPAGTTKEVVEDDEQDDLIHDSKELKVFRAEETQRVSLGDTANTAEFMRISKERGRASTLLVVDDEPLFRETIRSLLNTLGDVKDHVKVIEVDSAEMGLKQFETTVFDYVIADIDLGKNKMNGYKLTQEILEKHPNTHVLIHSNRRRDEMDERIRVIASPEGAKQSPAHSDVQEIATPAVGGLAMTKSRFMGFLPKPMKADELLQFLACKSFETSQQVEQPADLRTVLLLNDDTEFCFSMKLQLKSSAAQILDVNNISDALKHISQNKVDAIISDINLGNGEPDGYEFLKHVREKDTQVPFYFMSGYNKSSEWPKAEKLGATGYFQLPFCIEDARKELEL